MPTTRSQTAPQAKENTGIKEAREKPVSSKGRGAPKSSRAQKGKAKRKAADATADEDLEEPVEKKTKTDGEAQEEETGTKRGKRAAGGLYQTGTIERGHIYFFYRPRVQLEEAHDIGDVQRFYMLLVPRPPEFLGDEAEPGGAKKEESTDMRVLSPGADAVPAHERIDLKKKRFRLLVVGKKSLPDPDVGGAGKGSGRNQVFWATVTTISDNLEKLQEGLGEKEYETKTRGTRHQGPARLAARGAYAIVNTDAAIPSKRETHLGYHLSHPSPDEMGEVQAALGIHAASSFVLQVRNPHALPTGDARVGLPSNRAAKYPDEIMQGVFGKGGRRGRENSGLRFASVEQKELLDYEGTQLLFIAARSGEAGLENSLGEGRGSAMQEAEEKEAKETVEQVLKELAMDAHKIPAEPLEGEWA